MEKIKKIIIILIIFTLVAYILLGLVNQNSYAVTQTTSSDIDGINESLYPGVKEKIKTLKAQYPNWNFKILYTDLDWNEVIANEYTGHGSSPRNLVYKSTNYQGAWICSICGDKAYDNGSWRCASEQAIKYMMDPRNSINSSDIFQFEELTISGCDINIVNSMIAGTFLQGHGQGIVTAAQNNGINPYYIVARLIQEQGKSGSTLTAGKGYNGQYAGYYNAFNIGATGSQAANIILNGLAYAKTQGWTSLDASINGGISFLAKEYIKKGQNTLYLQKFDVESTYSGLYWHQYMQNILAAQSEGTTLRNTYINTNSLSSSHTFVIPVYKNMPAAVSLRPNTTENIPVSTDLVKVNVDSSLRLRNAANGSQTVGYLYKDEIATRLEKATSKVNGTYWDKIMKSDGVAGYAARETYESESTYKLYLIPVTNNSSSGTDGGNSSSGGTSGESAYKDTSSVKIDKTSKIATTLPDATVKSIKEAFGEVSVTDVSGKALGNSDQVGTGYKINGTYTIIKKGDCSGDGSVDARDAARILSYSIGQYTLQNEYLKAVDLNGDGVVDARDAARILSYSINQFNITI